MGIYYAMHSRDYTLAFYSHLLQRFKKAIDLGCDNPSAKACLTHDIATDIKAMRQMFNTDVFTSDETKLFLENLTKMDEKRTSALKKAQQVKTKTKPKGNTFIPRMLSYY